MFGKELLLPDTLIVVPALEKTNQELYEQELSRRMELAYESIRQNQNKIRNTNRKQPCAFRPENLVC